MTPPELIRRAWRWVARAVRSALARAAVPNPGRPARPPVDIGEQYAAAQEFDPAAFFNDPRWHSLDPNEFPVASVTTPSPPTRSVPHVFGTPHRPRPF